MPAPTAAATPDLGSRHSDADKEDGDLTSFRQLCHRLYYDKDPTSARKVDQILSRLPAQDRTTYARAMADVRSAYHRDHEIRRRARVEHLLCEVEPASIVKGAIGISPRSNDPSTAAMRSRAARRIRVERFKAFLSTNCHEATVMPGPHPFLRGLFATLWLQTRIPHNGCVEWTVDVAVLTEAGSGETWTRDAVELLKGVSWPLFFFCPLAQKTLVDTAASSGPRHVGTSPASAGRVNLCRFDLHVAALFRFFGPFLLLPRRFAPLRDLDQSAPQTAHSSIQHDESARRV